jgi:hypothetical protein
MDLADRSRMMGMTSSVTATMRSPKVVLMIFRWRMVFSLCRRVRMSRLSNAFFASPFRPDQRWTFGTTIGRCRPEIQRINALRLSSGVIQYPGTKTCTPYPPSTQWG